MPRRRGVPWVLLAVISLAIYIYLTFDTSEYNLYIILITLAVILIWLGQFFRKRYFYKQDRDISHQLSVHFSERLERDDFTDEVRVYDKPNQICEYCGAQLTIGNNFCENCGKSQS